MTALRPQRHGPRPVSGRAALAGALATVMLAVAVVSGLELLARPAARLPELDTPAEPEPEPVAPPAECPDAEALTEPVSVTADELIECPRAFHGLTVRYRGEAVRAVLRRDEWAWLHVNDDQYALEAGPIAAHRTAIGGNSGVPVRIPLAAADDVDVTGDGRHRGALVEVTGVWWVAGAGDGGAAGIRARTVDVEEPGHRVPPPRDPLRTWTAAVGAAAAGAVTVWSWAARRPRRGGAS